MIGIVVVSHSRKLADGVKELASLMTGGAVPILTAAGVSEDPDALGTDAVMISEALNELPPDADILVFMDQGSALLSSEMALELVEPEVAARVTLCSAPIVEGVVAAAAAASGGLGKDAALAEAREALAAKRDQLGEPPEAPVAAAAPAPAVSDAPVFEWTVLNPHGLHARPCARIVSALAGLTGTFTLARGEATANALSINQLARLGVRKGHAVRFLAAGADAAEARARFAALCGENFGESLDEPVAEAPKAPVEPVAAGVPSGIPVSDGVAIGPARWWRAADPVLPDRRADTPDTELSRLRTAIAGVETALRGQIADITARLGAAHADIFEAHRQILTDPALLDGIGTRLATGLTAEQAWHGEMSDTAAGYTALEDDYARARAADVRDVRNRVLIALGCAAAGTLRFGQPVVLLADDLSPSDTAALDPAEVLGLALVEGGRTSHSAILARALGLPAVAGMGAALRGVADGVAVALDGFAGTLTAEPAPDALADFTRRRDEWASAEKRRKDAASAPARTRDGFEPEVFVNVAGAADAARAVERGAGGIGLLRSEFLFLGREDLPDEDEQTDTYGRIADALGGRPVIIRTLDIGGDKPHPALGMAREENPFLGLRGVRLCLARPEMFDIQLRAILRAAATRPGVIRVMFPMIATVDEYRAAKDRLDRQRTVLAERGIVAGDVPAGVMIEVPAAVLSAGDLAREVAFFSIGTNDLTQYVMAADRGNAAVGALVDPFQPAVLRAIAATCRAAAATGIPVGMCGEMAGDPRATALLLGLGVTELSMSGGAVAGVKERIRSLSLADCRTVAESALAAASIAEVKRLG